LQIYCPQTIIARGLNRGNGNAKVKILLESYTIACIQSNSKTLVDQLSRFLGLSIKDENLSILCLELFSAGSAVIYYKYF
jgi:hypothetical protein